MATITTAQNAEIQSSLTPSDAIQQLVEGNQRFVSGNPVSRDLHAQIRETATGQYPSGAVLSCID